MGRSYQIMHDAALDAKGREWRNWIIAFKVARWALPWLALSALLGGLGYAARWAWIHLTAISAAPAVAAAPDAHDVAHPVASATGILGAVPGWLWAIGAVFAVWLVWAFRPGRLMTRGERRLRAVPAFAMVLVVAGMAGLALSGANSIG